MEINVADQRILLFSPQLNGTEAQEKAWQKKTIAFDTLSKVSSFLSPPKDEDFELTYQEYRYQPFWHVIAKAHYKYDRTNQYQVPTSAKEVERLTINQADHEVIQGHIHLSVVEHCVQEEQDEVFVDGLSGKTEPNLKKYLSHTFEQVKTKLETKIPSEAILVPPHARVSAIMRDSLSKMIKGIQADTILEEIVEVPYIDLYYHPVYAFQYLWKSKQKEAIVEVDGLTGQIVAGDRTFSEYLGKVLDTNFLFDLGADAAGMLIPGGSIAVKVAKKYLDSK